LTVEEAAERIGICRSNMFKLIRQGEVESVRIGRLRRVTPAALEDYVRGLSPREGSAACLGTSKAARPTSDRASTAGKTATGTAASQSASAMTGLLIDGM
jgi:excisionase family DNA binding protein